MRRPVLPGVQRLIDVERRQHFLVSGLGDLMGQLLPKNVVANAEQIRGPFDLGIASDLHSVVVVFILRKNKVQEKQHIKLAVLGLLLLPVFD